MKNVIKNTESGETHGYVKEIAKQNYNSEAELEKAKEKMKDNTQILEREPIPETPFTCVKIDEEYYIMMGKYRLNMEPFKTKEEVFEDASNTSWQRLMQVMRITAEDVFLNVRAEEIKHFKEHTEKLTKEKETH